MPRTTNNNTHRSVKSVKPSANEVKLQNQTEQTPVLYQEQQKINTDNINVVVSSLDDETGEIETKIVTITPFFERIHDPVLRERAQLRFNLLKAKIANAIANNESISDILSDNYPQGITVSHTMPFVENMFKSAGDTFGSINKSINEFFSGKAFDTTCVYLLIALILVTLLIPAQAKQSKIRSTLMHVRHVIIEIITIIVVFNMVTQIETNSESIKYLTVAFEDEIYLYREASTAELQEENNDLIAPEILMEEVIMPQGAEFFLPGAVTLMGLCLAGLTGFKPRDPLVSVLTSFTKISTAQTSNFTTFLIAFSNGLSTFFKETGFIAAAEYFELGITDDEAVNKYVKDVSSFTVQLNSGNLKSYLYLNEVYDSYIQKGAQLVKDSNKNSYASRLLTDVIKNLRNGYDKLEATKHALNGTRVEPVSVLIRGTPGCFKSVLCSRLSRVVAHHSIPDEWKEDFAANPKEFYYSMPNDKFYDGYTSRAWVTLKDDIFQQRDVAGATDSDALKVINIVNTQPYTLPMAAVELKNNSYFRSPFFFATTNLNNFTMLESVVNSAAVSRRFHLEVNVSVSEKYTSGKMRKVNGNKLPTESIAIDEELITGTVIPEDFWEISVIRKAADRTFQAEKVDFSTLARMILEEHKIRIKNFYFNKHSEQSSILDIFSEGEINEKINSMYSKMYMNAIRPQSANFGTFSNEETEEAWQNFMDAGDKRREDIEEAFYDLCYEFPALNLTRTFHIKELFKVCQVLNMTEELDSMITTYPGKIHKFFDKLRPAMLKTISRGVHPITFCALREITPPTNAQKIVKRLRYLGKTIGEFLSRYKILIITVLPVILASIYFLSKFISGVTGSAEAQSSLDFSRDRARTPGKKPVSALSKYAPGLSAVSQSAEEVDISPDLTTVHGKITTEDLGTAEANNSIVTNVINKSMFILNVVTKIKTYRMGHALNLQGQIFLVPIHFFYKLTDLNNSEMGEGAEVVLSTATNSTKFTVPLTEIIKTYRTTQEGADNDMVIFKVESAHRNAVGLLKYIMEEKDLVQLKNRQHKFKATVTGTYNKKAETSQLLVRTNNVTATFHGEIIVNAEWQGKQEDPVYALPNVIGYDGSFFDGDCGSILTINSNKYASRIICGMHVAGSKKLGFSTMLSKERIMLIMRAAEYEFRSVLTDELPDYVVSTPVDAQGVNMPVGILTPSMTPSRITKSNYQRSLMFGYLPEPFKTITHFPARLKTFTATIDGIKQEIDPLMIAADKYAQHSKYIDSDVLTEAIGSYEELVTEHMCTPYSQRKPISVKEALHAFGNVKGISPTTSPGFPMSLPDVEDLKTLYYKSVYEADPIDTKKYLERIANIVQVRIGKYLDGERVPIFSKGVLKDELRKLEKVKNGSTRMFLAGEFIHFLMCRMYFGPFMSAFIEANYKVGSAIGLNPYSRDWDVVARELIKFGNDIEKENIGAGDYSSFDTSQFAQKHWAIFDMMIRWYGNSITEEDKTVMFFLFIEVVNSRHIIDNKVFERDGTMPSGTFLTAMVNTIDNNINFRLAFHYSGCPISQYNSSVYMIGLGDDNVFTCSDIYTDRFNELTIPIGMAKVHMTYTTEDKGKATRKFRKLSEIDFLKRSFILDKSLNRFIAPMQIEALFVPLNWSSKKDEGDEINVNQLSTTMLELSLHGKEIYDKYFPALQDLKNWRYADLEPDVVVTPEWAATKFKILNLEHQY